VTDLELAVPPAVIRRVAFMGTPAAAVPCLRALVETGYEVPLVVSQPDRRRGRGSKLIPSAVKQAAVDLGLVVTDDPNALLAVDSVDLAVVVAYGRLLRRPLLEAVPMINVHFSLLPRWRGAAPVERSILAGDSTTGVCIMQMTEGLDEGPVFDVAEVEIGPNDTAHDLTVRLAELGAGLLISTIQAGLAQPTPQQGAVTYAHKLDRAEFRLDFSRPAVELHRRVRIGRAWTTFRGSRLGIEECRLLDHECSPGRLELLSSDPTDGDFDGRHDGPMVVAGTGENSLILISVKPEGRRAMRAIDWWNGFQPKADELLGH